MKETVYLSFDQLMSFGMHIGHSYNNYVMLSTWICLGFSKEVYIIDLMHSLFGFHTSFKMLTRSTFLSSPIWFVSLNTDFGHLVASYGALCGEPFFHYGWMGGVLTNFSRVMRWHKFLLNLLSLHKYEFRHMDKWHMSNFLGLIFNSRRIPAVGIIMDVLDSYIAVDEFGKARIPSIGMVDSNVQSWNLAIPIPGNDDSMICNNFYLYFFTKVIMLCKLKMKKTWFSKLYYSRIKYSRAIYKKLFFKLMMLNDKFYMRKFFEHYEMFLRKEKTSDDYNLIMNLTKFEDVLSTMWSTLKQFNIMYPNIPWKLDDEIKKKNNK